MSRHHTNWLGRLSFAAFAAGLVACGSSATVTTPTDQGSGQSLTVERMNAPGASVQGSPNTGPAADTGQRRVITDASSWATFWTSLSPDPRAGGGAPSVDFASEMVIAAVSPLRPSGGYQVQIESVTEWADHIDAVVVTRSPASDCFTTGVITRPFDVVRVARRAKPVRFVERTTVTSCGTPPAASDTVRAQFGKAVDTRGVRVTLLKVISDSRCPMNALCIWEGDAAVTVRFEQGGQTTDVTLHTSPKIGAVSTKVGSVEFQLIGLTPFLVAGQNAPAESSYTAILVTK